MPITPDAYRDALRHFAAGVTIVTIKSGEETRGLTVSAFVSISPDPPLIAVVIDQSHHAHGLLERDDVSFAVNILGADQAELSNRFAFLKDDNRFAEGDWTTAETGAPILTDAIAWMDCTLQARHPAGTHTILVGEIQASAVPREDQAPLVYWNREYRRLRF